MAGEAQHPVVILYQHPLLGEGIARYLFARIGVEATVVPADEPEMVRSALANRPDVIIFESSAQFLPFSLTTLAPQAVLIDLSTVIAKGSIVPCPADFEQILQAVRDSGSPVARPAESALQ